MQRPGPLTPLGDARQWLDDRKEEGATCPCCGQHAKLYRRTITSGIAYALIGLYRGGAGNGFVHKPTVLRGWGSASRDESTARYWGLLVEETTHRPDGGRAGYWRLTLRGIAFVRDAGVVQKYSLVYNGECLGHEGSMIGIRDALGEKFDYAELMAR